MKKAWCPQCGAETWEVQGRTGPILVNPATPETAAADKIRVHFYTQEGTSTTTHHWTIHRCKEILYPKRRHITALNAARRAVGLDPVEERGDSA